MIVDEITAPQQVQAVVDEAVGEVAPALKVEQPVAPSIEQPLQPAESVQATSATSPSQGGDQSVAADTSALDELEKMIAEQQNKKDSQVVNKSPNMIDKPVVAPAHELREKRKFRLRQLFLANPVSQFSLCNQLK